MTIIELRNEITNKMMRIPKFIQTTSSLDHAVWNNMRYISDVLLQLLSDKIIKQSTIEAIVECFVIELEMITDVSDKVELIELYYLTLLQHILERAIDEERFETATNIRNYITVYKNRYQL